MFLLSDIIQTLYDHILRHLLRQLIRLAIPVQVVALVIEHSTNRRITIYICHPRLWTCLTIPDRVNLFCMILHHITYQMPLSLIEYITVLQQIGIGQLLSCKRNVDVICLFHQIRSSVFL